MRCLTSRANKYEKSNFYLKLWSGPAKLRATLIAIYTAFASEAKGLFQLSAECCRLAWYAVSRGPIDQNPKLHQQKQSVALFGEIAVEGSPYSIQQRPQVKNS